MKPINAWNFIIQNHFRCTKIHRRWHSNVQKMVPLFAICRIIRETGHTAHFQQHRYCPHLVITTCTIRQLWVLSQKASVLVRVGLGYLNYYLSFTTTDVGFNTPPHVGPN